MVRFIHAADIHLDSPLRGLSAYEGAPVEALRTATRKAFVRLVDTAVDEAVDFVVIAGDLYDGDWPDANTGLFFCREMGRLDRAGIPVVVAYGNHDAESQFTRRLPLPANVHVFRTRTVTTVRLDPCRTALHGRSFKQPDTVENFVPGYPKPVSGWLNIGVLHTALEGNASHARYAPCTLEELRRHGYDYWALGHVHEHAILSEEPWVVFPGNLQGRHIRETGPRGAVLVTGDAGALSVERLILDVLRWAHLRVDASRCASFGDVVDAIGSALAGCLHGGADDRPLAVRVSVSGVSPAHGALFGLEGQLRDEVLANVVALTSDGLWLERVVIETEAPPTTEARSAVGDALVELGRILALADADDRLTAEISDALMELTRKAPREVVEAVPDLERVRAGDVGAVIRRVAPGVLARIASDA